MLHHVCGAAHPPDSELVCFGSWAPVGLSLEIEVAMIMILLLSNSSPSSGCIGDVKGDTAHQR
jgi:hypothetical protein